jgi:hypothetical protein
MAIPSYDDPREGNFATFELLPLNSHLIFSNLFKACLLSCFEFGSTAFASKVTTDVTPMVVTIVWGFVK